MPSNVASSWMECHGELSYDEHFVLDKRDENSERKFYILATSLTSATTIKRHQTIRCKGEKYLRSML